MRLGGKLTRLNHAQAKMHTEHTQASKQSKTTVGATNGNKLPQNKARRHKGIIGQEIYVTCIRSSPHHGSRTRGPRDDGFRQGFLFLDLQDFANRRQHLELIRNHVKPAHRRGSPTGRVKCFEEEKGKKKKKDMKFFARLN